MLPTQPCFASAFREDEVIYRIIASIIYQMVRKIPSISRHVGDAIDNDPLIFTRTAEVQIQDLIVKPWIAAANDFPERRHWASTVVVDGSHQQVSEKSACIRVFDAIESISNDRKWDAPLVLILTSPTPDTFLARILAIFQLEKHSAISVLVGLSFARA
ncbi:hypothetical protein BJ912DRAFT_318289 [Pholiota molesta]|nr:hypothetical protein BJ912DRAFT_318289 [Pholiota molesta]